MKRGFMSAEIKHFFDPQSSTLTYVVYDPASRDAVVIDPVWDFDAASEVTGSCHGSLGNKIGLRPTCWFKPSL